MAYQAYSAGHQTIEAATDWNNLIAAVNAMSGLQITISGLVVTLRVDLNAVSGLQITEVARLTAVSGLQLQLSGWQVSGVTRAEFNAVSGLQQTISGLQVTIRTDLDAVSGLQQTISGLTLVCGVHSFMRGRYCPMTYRMDEQALVYYAAPHFVCRAHRVSGHYSSWISAGRSFGYGTYQWRAYAVNPPPSGAFLSLGFFEHHHGWAAEGIIGIAWHGEATPPRWNLTTSENGTYEFTWLSGFTCTTETDIRIRWNASGVRLWVGTLTGSGLAFHSGVIPSGTMQFGSEAGVEYDVSAGQPEPAVYFRQESFYRVGP